MALTPIVKGDCDTFECTIDIDITGYKIRFEMYDAANSIKKANDLSGGGISQIKVSDAINGEFDIYINNGETSDFSSKANIEIEIESPNGNITTPYQDTIVLKEQKISWKTP